MRNSFLIIALLSFTSVLAQSSMENDCSKCLRNISKKVTFPTFNKSVFVSKDTFKFDGSVLIISGTDSKLLAIFKQGLIFPTLIKSAKTYDDRSFKLIQSSTPDTILINSVEDITPQNQSPKLRTFRFFIRRERFANPSLYIFELTNWNSNSRTSISLFIKKSKLTTFGFCSILI